MHNRVIFVYVNYDVAGNISFFDTNGQLFTHFVFFGRFRQLYIQLCYMAARTSLDEIGFVHLRTPLIALINITQIDQNNNQLIT